MKLVISLFALVATSASAQTDSWNSYDWQSGNSYSNHADPQGVTTYGTNLQNGSSWQLRQNNDGSYSGRDSEGNYFQGNQNTGTYYNYGTGEGCYGTGAFRTCY